MPEDITTTAGPPSPASRIVPAGTVRPMIGAARALSPAALDEVRAEYAAWRAGGWHGLDHYRDLRRYGHGEVSALATVRWAAARRARRDGGR